VASGKWHVESGMWKVEGGNVESGTSRIHVVKQMMKPTICAIFDDSRSARLAVEELTRLGTSANDVTVAGKAIQPPFHSDERPPLDPQEFGSMAGTFPDLRAGGSGSSAESAVGGSGARYAGIAATTNASSDPGAMTDLLWAALPDDVARHYRNQYEGGKTIVLVHDPKPDTEQVLRQMGAIEIHRAGYLA
jgi:hypothetical protein